MVAEFHELVRRQLGQERQVVRSAREQDRRHLTRTASDGQDRAREDTRQRLWHEHVADGLPARRTQRQRGLALVARHRAQRLFRGHDDDRQVEQRQRERRPHERRLSPHDVEPEEAVGPTADELDEEPEPEQAIHDARHASQVVHREPHRLREPRILARVQVKPHGGADTERHECDDHEHHEQQGPVDGREDAALGHALARCAGKELPRHRARPVPHDVAQDDDHHRHDQERRKACQRREPAPTPIDPMGAASPGRRRGVGRVDRAHAPASFLRSRSTNRPAATLIRNVTVNKRAPRKNSVA